MATAVRAKRPLTETLRPYLVIAGLVLSFSVVTLAGSALLSLLHLPQDAIRWIGIAALTVIGVGLIFPRFEELLEKPFARIPQMECQCGSKRFRTRSRAGSAVRAVRRAGAGRDRAGRRDRYHRHPHHRLTVSFAIGTAIPLLVFALAGQQVAERIGAFRRRQRQIRVAGGIVMLTFAVAIALNVPALLQRAIPDYTSSLQDKLGRSDQIAGNPDLGGLSTTRTRTCRSARTAPPSSKAAAPHQISKASPDGSTPPVTPRST